MTTFRSPARLADVLLARSSDTVVLPPVTYRKSADSTRHWYFSVVSSNPTQPVTIDHVIAGDSRTCFVMRTELIASVMLASMGRKFQIFIFEDEQPAFAKAYELWPCTTMQRWCKSYEEKRKTSR